jgi:hypothetical protein
MRIVRLLLFVIHPVIDPPGTLAAPGPLVVSGNTLRATCRKNLTVLQYSLELAPESAC